MTIEAYSGKNSFSSSAQVNGPSMSAMPAGPTMGGRSRRHRKSHRRHRKSHKHHRKTHKKSRRHHRRH
jgi:hypothetical protein